MHRNTVKYHQLRDELIRRLGGGKCARAGLVDLRGEYPPCHELIEVDHIDGRDYEVSALRGIQRIKKYLAELDAGVRLQLLCKTHNGSDGYSKGQTRERARRDRRAKRLCTVSANEEG